MAASFVLKAFALRFGQLSAVEPVITLEVPLTVVVAPRAFTVRVGSGEWTGILLMTAGMVILVAALHPRPGNECYVRHSVYAFAGGPTAAVIKALVLATRRGPRSWRTACCV